MLTLGWGMMCEDRLRFSSFTASHTHTQSKYVVILSLPFQHDDSTKCEESHGRKAALYYPPSFQVTLMLPWQLEETHIYLIISGILDSSISYCCTFIKYHIVLDRVLRNNYFITLSSVIGRIFF